MENYAALLANSEILAELREKLPDLVASAQARGSKLEGLDVIGDIPRLEHDVRAMAEGAATMNEGLEAIVCRFTRPVMLVQDQTCGSVPDYFQNSRVIRGIIDNAKTQIDAALPSLGRIDLFNHRNDYAGTGWMVAPEILVTNQHVAKEFAQNTATGFEFVPIRGGGHVEATVDWYREYDRGDHRTRVEVDEILWIERPQDFDVAFVHLQLPAEPESALPQPLDLMTQQEMDELHQELTRTDASPSGLPWVAVIGYPAQSMWENPQDQQRIFDGIYGYKRLAVGQIMGLNRHRRLLQHDATTLGGNSGSAVLSLSSGKVAGLHFQGDIGKQNDAVQAPVLIELLEEHVL